MSCSACDAERKEKGRQALLPGMRALLSMLFWEFVQNLGLVAGFYFALDLWLQERWLGALFCLVGGSVVGSSVIYATEARIVPGHREPPRVLLTNVVSMAALMFLAVLYLAAPWASWKTDLLVGGVAGLLLGSVQSLAAREPIGVRHCLSLACALALCLAGIRALTLSLPPVGGTFIVTSVVTVIIGLLDYAGHVSQAGSRNQNERRSE